MNDVDQVIEAAADDVFDRLMEDAGKTVSEWRSSGKEFEQRLLELWGDAIGRLELLYFKSIEAGEYFAALLGESEEHDLRHSYLLVQTHARTCQVTSEIIALLKSGHANGAMARWRALFESSITLGLLSEGGPRIGKRFLDRYDVLDEKLIDYYDQHKLRAQLSDLDPEVVRAIKESAHALKRNAGSAVTTERGWARPFLKAKGIKAKGSPSLADLAESVGIDHRWPYYIYSNHLVHINPKTFKLVGDYVRDRSLPAGASNAGLDLPGQLAAVSLHQATCFLLDSAPADETILVMMTVLGRITEATKRTFVQSEAEYQRLASEKKPLK